MQVIVFGKQAKERDLPTVQSLFESLDRHGVTCFVYEPYFKDLVEAQLTFPAVCGRISTAAEVKNRRFDACIVLGGDGTMLAAVALIRDAGVPLLGINLGRLGFLASIEKTRIDEAVQSLRKGAFRIVDRSLLYLESLPHVFGDVPYALNDCTILKRDTSSMITIHVFLNGDFLNTYWADGIIISTPTGSTGYSLSCGGPIIFPDSKNFVLTPVAPHNLNMRPLVIADDSILTFEVEGRADNFLITLDSRFETVSSHHQLAVRKNDFPAKLLQLEDQTFLHTIREKLQWGSDIRN